MPHLRIVRDDPAAIHLAHRHQGGLVGIALGSALAYALQRFVPPSTVGDVAIGMGIFFVVVGLMGWLWRDGLEIDLVARRWRRTRGLVFVPTTSEGALDAVEGLSIDLEWDRERRGSSRRTVPEWEVGLILQPGDRPITFFETKEASGAYRLAESLAARLQVRILDRTDRRDHSV